MAISVFRAVSGGVEFRDNGITTGSSEEKGAAG
jgi:hypothetical protein